MKLLRKIQPLLNTIGTTLKQFSKLSLIKTLEFGFLVNIWHNFHGVNSGNARVNECERWAWWIAVVTSKGKEISPLMLSLLAFSGFGGEETRERKELANVQGTLSIKRAHYFRPAGFIVWVNPWSDLKQSRCHCGMLGKTYLKCLLFCYSNILSTIFKIH